jgi:hypothetical protein
VAAVETANVHHNGIGIEQLIDGVIDICRQPEGGGEIVPRAEGDEAKRHDVERTGNHGHAVQHFVERPVAPADEQTFDPFAGRVLRQLSRVPFRDRHRNIQQPRACAQPLVDRHEVVRRGIGAGHGVDDELRLHVSVRAD